MIIMIQLFSHYFFVRDILCICLFSLVTLSSKIELHVHSSGFPFATSYGSATVPLETVVRENGGNGKYLMTVIVQWAELTL